VRQWNPVIRLGDIRSICMAKPQYSLSHDPDAKGVPTGFTIKIRNVRAVVARRRIHLSYLWAVEA
jgi:formyltetrahydrofolate synthetase